MDKSMCVCVCVVVTPQPAIISHQTGPTKPAQLDNEIHYDLVAKRTARKNKDMCTHTHKRAHAHTYTKFRVHVSVCKHVSSLFFTVHADVCYTVQFFFSCVCVSIRHISCLRGILQRVLFLSAT